MKVKLNAVDSIQKLARDVAHESKADVFLYSGGIEYPSDYYFIGKVRRHRKHANAIVLLTTNGGIADSAYRMMRALRAMYPDGKITVYISTSCKSAGTLMAVGADELVMGSVAELGPLDVQVRKPDEVGEYSSGLTPLQALTALRTEAFNCFEQHFLMLRERSGRQITAKTAAEIAVKLTVGWFQPIYEQLDPMRLSETQRAMMIAWDYGVRLACGNIDEKGLERLITGYPSHGFIIDREEARSIFSKVRAPTAAELALTTALIHSDLVDEGMEGTNATVVALSSEACVLGTECAWEGIEYEDGTPEKSAKPRGQAKRSVGAPAKRSNAKPVRGKDYADRAAKESDGNPLPQPVERK